MTMLISNTMDFYIDYYGLYYRSFCLGRCGPENVYSMENISILWPGWVCSGHSNVLTDCPLWLSSLSLILIVNKISCAYKNKYFF
jgi:hypothetical protein